MLNFVNPEMMQNEDLMNVVKDFRRVQVSRFPLNVEFSSNGIDHSIRFYDSRFDTRHPVAAIWDEKDKGGEMYWVLESRLIVNDRYRSRRKNQKHTKDLKKLLRYMRDYIRPLSAKDIAMKNKDAINSHVGRWKYEAMEKMRSACDLNRDELMQEMLHMHAVGYKPQTEKFAKVMKEGVVAWQEYKKRSDRLVMRLHVFINPDESIEAFCDDKLGCGDIEQGTTTFNSLSEMPMSVQQNLAMLRMLEDNSFVPEVGSKVDANNYWVEVHPE